MKRILAVDAEMTPAAIKKKLGKKYEISDGTIGNIRSDFRQSLAVLQEVGELKTLKV